MLEKPRRTSDGDFSPTKFGYWLGVKQKSWKIRDKLSGYLPITTYIWKGADSGGSKDTNGDGKISDDEKNLDDVPWCFAYGEADWIKGLSFKKVKEQTQRHVYSAARKKDVNNEVKCP